MLLHVLVINTQLIQGKELEKVINIVKDGYDTKKLPSANHLLLVAVREEDTEDILSDLEDLNLGNPAYEITEREISNQEELNVLSLIIELEPR